MSDTASPEITSPEADGSPVVPATPETSPEPVAAPAPIPEPVSPAPAVAAPVIDHPAGRPPAPAAAAPNVPTTPISTVAPTVTLTNVENALRTYHMDHASTCKVTGECTCEKKMHPQMQKKGARQGFVEVTKLHPKVLTFMPKQKISGLPAHVLLAPEIRNALNAKLLRQS